MRLTLRTLLAWLDDTLPPNEVRQIGHQVSESPFAQELVERIHRVTRQRRLTVPNSSGGEATDANQVASYLDNELDSDQVADYEKRCLTSDVHLAEVASVHQILSLIGQKAKVPTEARNRMYRLVKGREAVGSRVPRAYGPPPPDTLTEPLVPWAPPEPPPRSWVERFGPAAFVVLLIAVLIWSTWISLNPSESSRTSAWVPAQAPPGAPLAGPAKKAAGAPGPNAPARPLAAAATTPAASTPAPGESAAAPGTEAVPAAEATQKGTAENKLPPGAIGVTSDTDDLLLRFNANTRAWERIKGKAPLRDDDRLVSPEHYLNALHLGSAPVKLLGDTEIRLRRPGQGRTAEFELARGRVIIGATDPPTSVGIRFGGKLVTVTPPASSSIGLETTAEGREQTALQIFTPQGDAQLASDDAKETLEGPGAITFRPGEKFTGEEKKDTPGWVTDPSPSPLDKQIGEQFAHYFKSDREVIKSLLEAMDDKQKDVRELAVSTLGSLGQVDLVVSALSTPNQSATRRAAIRTLRRLMRQGGESLKDVQAVLGESLGKDESELVEKLLTGYSAREAQAPATYSKLVQHLTSNDPGVRELALDNLESLTGRSDLGYDPDHPEGEGPKRWQELLRQGALKPLGAPAAKEQEGPGPAPAAKKAR